MKRLSQLTELKNPKRILLGTVHDGPKSKLQVRKRLVLKSTLYLAKSDISSPKCTEKNWDYFLVLPLPVDSRQGHKGRKL